MRSYPVFAPFADGYINALVTIPDGEARGVVALLSYATNLELVGSNARTWVARLLASRGIASVRLDYEGFGDSTGVAPTLLYGDAPAQAEQVRAVLRAVCGDGQLPYGALGSCHDALIALDLARDERFVAVACMNVPLVPSTRWNTFGRRLRRMRIVGLLRSRSRLRRVLGYERARSALRDRPDRQTRRSVRAAVGAERVLFLRNDAIKFLDEGVAGYVAGVNDIETTIDPQAERERPALEEEASLVMLADWFSKRFAEASPG